MRLTSAQMFVQMLDTANYTLTVLHVVLAHEFVHNLLCICSDRRCITLMYVSKDAALFMYSTNGTNHPAMRLSFALDTQLIGIQHCRASLKLLSPPSLAAVAQSSAALDGC